MRVGLSTCLNRTHLAHTAARLWLPQYYSFQNHVGDPRSHHQPPIMSRDKRHSSTSRAAHEAHTTSTKDTFTSAQLPYDIHIDALIRSHRSNNADAWVTILDYTLPQRLRTTQPISHFDYQTGQDLQRLATISKIISCARDLAKIDLLSYVGVHKGRWDAVNWLANLILTKSHGHKQENAPGWQLALPVWPSQSNSLDEVSDHPIFVDLPETSKISLDQLYDWEADAERTRDFSIIRNCLAQLWQALGCLILQAEDKSTSPDKAHSIMSHVLDLLAQIHHMKALPASIYNYSPAKDSSVIQRSPTLYLLSARIMAVLSDVAWNKHWISEMQKAKEYGYELPKARVQPQLPHVGAEIWLELVLWACVEGNWMSAAAWIVSEMEKRRKEADNGWSVISWDELCQTKAPKLEWTAILKLQIDKSRLNQSTGIGIANSGTTSVEMGARTISREVVSAILDGIINRVSTKPAVFGTRLETVHQHVVECTNLLRNGEASVDAGTINTLVVRIIESAALDARVSNSYTANIIRNFVGLEYAFEHNRSASATKDEYMLDTSAPVLGLLHRNLHDFSLQGYYRGILRSIGNIQDLIDANRHLYIQEFANELRERLKQGQDDMSSIRTDEKRPSPMLYPHIPVYVLSCLLKSVVGNKFDELGRWIMHNEDIDGGIFPARLYGSPTLQPALLDFATATSDEILLNQILETAQPPLSTPMLHAILRCQIALDKWPAVRDTLYHFKISSSTNWSSEDALAIAAAVVRLGKSASGKGAARQAQTALFDLLRGEFDHSQSPSQRRDLTKIQQANQLKRLLRSLPGGIFDFLVLEDAREAGPLSSTCRISSDGFIMFLEEMVKRFGASAGQRFWQQWCLSPDDRYARQINVYSVNRSTGDSTEKVVLPTISMLRTIIKPIVRKFQQQNSARRNLDLKGNSPANNDDPLSDSILAPSKVEAHSHADLALLGWAIPFYRQFGFDDKAIRREVPGIPRWLISQI